MFIRGEYMNSIVSYKNRGPFGDSSYRGNCSGYVIKDLIEEFYKNSKPKRFIEVFSRWWNRKRYCKEIKY